MSFDPGMLHSNGHTAYANGTSAGIRETGVVEKLLTSYGFIQCSERQARLFFHCSQYNGNLLELKIGGESRTHTHLPISSTLESVENRLPCPYLWNVKPVGDESRTAPLPPELTAKNEKKM